MLYRTIYIVIRETRCAKRQILCTLESVSKYRLHQYNTHTNVFHRQQNLYFAILKRLKSKKSFEEDEYEEEQDVNNFHLDEYLNTDKSKVIKTTVPSLRLDAVAKASFGLSRAKLEKEFYKSNIRINGEKCLKKSKVIQVGDEIDLIQGRSPDNPNNLIVHRCVLLNARADLEKETIHAELIQTKSLLIEDYSDKWYKDY